MRVCGCCILFAVFLYSSHSLADDNSGNEGKNVWSYGVTAGLGYFNFRDSLYIDREPDPSGDLGEDWAEFYVKPWLEYGQSMGGNVIFAKGSWAYVRTDDDAAEIGGGAADSADFDDLYVGIRRGSTETGLIEVAGGRFPYEMAHGFLLSDGNADGGSRGSYWSNPRTAWAPAARFRYANKNNALDIFYLERDERPESNADTKIAGINYEWRSAGDK